MSDTGTGPVGAMALREVRERHGGFVEWFTSGRDEAVFEAMMAAFGPRFALVDPSGEVFDRARVDDMLRGARATRASDFRIAIEDGTVLWETADAALVGYVERQWMDGRVTARRSTALFTRNADAPCGVRWNYLHETWTEPPS